jgi:hypothetical protein
MSRRCVPVTLNCAQCRLTLRQFCQIRHYRFPSLRLGKISLYPSTAGNPKHLTMYLPRWFPYWHRVTIRATTYRGIQIELCAGD